MPASTMMYVLSHITNNIPVQLLELAFKPRQYNTTIENRIIGQVVEGPVLLDTNLVGGKAREIILQSSWQMNLTHVQSFGIMGAGMEASYYQVPPEAREGRNISSVLGVASFAGGTYDGFGVGYQFTNQRGNNASSLAREMLNTYTYANTPAMPRVTLEGTNILKFYPGVLTDGVAIRVMLEYDAEFLNLNPSGIKALQALCLCATKRFIVKELIVPVDETEVVAGMEIGIIKSLIQDYANDAKEYDELLVKLKGAMHYDAATMNRLMYYSL